MSNLSPEQLATLKLQREMSKATNTSIYDGRGNLEREKVREMTQGNVYIGEYLNLDSIPWAPDPYGSDHSIHLARLAEYMAQLPGTHGGVVGGPLDLHDQKCIHACSMLYAVGHAQGREGYERRSAEFAEKFFREGGGAGTYWSKPEVREETCRLIFRHTDAAAIAEDKRLQVFADAVRYELARITPNTGEGLALIQEQCRQELFHLGFSKDKLNFRGYMISRGWK